MKFSVIVVGIQHPGNLGAIARVCVNFNVENLYLIAPLCKINDHAYERATHGRRYLDNAIIVDELSDVRPQIDWMIALSARAGGKTSIFRSSIPIDQILVQIDPLHRDGHIGIVIGRENSGLRNDEVDICDFLTILPLPGDNKVLNISHATVVALWALQSSFNKEMPMAPDGNEQQPYHQLMGDAERKALFTIFNKIIHHSWIPEDKYNGAVRSFTSLIGRAMITKREANSIIGTFRNIFRSLDGEHPPWDKCSEE